MFAVTAVPCILPSKYAFIWSSHKLYCLNERMESLFCKWKQLKVVVNIPVDMYHFCTNKFTLVESVFVFEIFSGFVCCVIHSFTAFQAAEFAAIILHICLTWKSVLCFSLTNKKGTKRCKLCTQTDSLLLDLTTWHSGFKRSCSCQPRHCSHLLQRQGVCRENYCHLPALLSFLSYLLLCSSWLTVPSSPAPQTKSFWVHDVCFLSSLACRQTATKIRSCTVPPCRTPSSGALSPEATPSPEEWQPWASSAQGWARLPLPHVLQCSVIYRDVSRTHSCSNSWWGYFNPKRKYFINAIVLNVYWWR